MRRLSDFKYLTAYLMPLSAVVGFALRGPWLFATPIFAFGIIPFFELLIPPDATNLPKEEAKEKRISRVFDWMLYLNVPVVYGMLGWFFWILTHHSLSVTELAGLILSMGIVTGTNGINVAHELGHRSKRFDRFLADCLLLPALYLHFRIEHNRGHHVHVGTREDPSTARRGEFVYFFWLRSTTNTWWKAWILEAERLRKNGLPMIGLRNAMLIGQSVQVAMVVAIGLLFSWTVAVYFFASAVVGFLLLESINYIEHYGLEREKMADGRYERVRPRHSWNSNYQFGRIVLYELTRHSDHHFLANKRYQILDHHQESPQLPVGYPAAMLAALVPPLWFRMIHPQLDQFAQMDAGSSTAN